MKEIKFRAWDEKRKHWDYFTISNILTYQKYLQEHIVNGDEFYLYSGLKDRNGKEIYEGDIVECPVEIQINICKWETKIEKRIIQFKNGAFRQFNHLNDYYGWTLKDFEIHDIQFEIIGNIYENPELVGG